MERLRTKDLNESKTSVWHDLEHKREIQGRYMFTLAFENANEDDWVTEKLLTRLRWFNTGLHWCQQCGQLSSMYKRKLHHRSAKIR